VVPEETQVTPVILDPVEQLVSVDLLVILVHQVTQATTVQLVLVVQALPVVEEEALAKVVLSTMMFLKVDWDLFIPDILISILLLNMDPVFLEVPVHQTHMV
jgi:isochorismate synthase EntC